MVVGMVFGFTMLANYHFAAQYLLLIESIPISIGQYLIPQEAEGQKNKKMKLFFILLSCIVAIISIIAIPYGVTTFIPKYEESIVPIQIMSVGIIPLTIVSIQGVQFLGKENSRIVLIGSVLQSGSFLTFIILLGQAFGLVGLATGFLSAIIIRAIFNFLIDLRIHRNNDS